MPFQSQTSKQQSESTVNKLLSNILPGSTVNVTSNPSGKQLAAAQLAHKEIRKAKLSSHEIKKINQINKAKQNKNINSKMEKEKKFMKLMKYNLIKKHKEEKKLSIEESKYLKKLVKKNANMVKRVSEISDYEINSDLNAIRNEILLLTNPSSSKRKLDKKKNDFNAKIKKGAISYPGLTPGLAPVGLEDDSDDE